MGACSTDQNPVALGFKVFIKVKVYILESLVNSCLTSTELRFHQDWWRVNTVKQTLSSRGRSLYLKEQKIKKNNQRDKKTIQPWAIILPQTCLSTLKPQKVTNVIIMCFSKLIISAHRTDFSLVKDDTLLKSTELWQFTPAEGLAHWFSKFKQNWRKEA